MTPVPPAPGKLPAHAKAAAVLARYAATLGLSELLQQICHDEHIELLEADQRDIAGVLRRVGHRWQITLSRQDAADRRLFTLAHLLGHYFLHGATGRTFVQGMFVGGRYEPSTY